MNETVKVTRTEQTITTWRVGDIKITRTVGTRSSGKRTLPGVTVESAGPGDAPAIRIPFDVLETVATTIEEAEALGRETRIGGGLWVSSNDHSVTLHDDISNYELDMWHADAAAVAQILDTIRREAEANYSEPT